MKTLGIPMESAGADDTSLEEDTKPGFSNLEAGIIAVSTKFATEVSMSIATVLVFLSTPASIVAVLPIQCVSDVLRWTPRGFGHPAARSTTTCD